MAETVVCEHERLRRLCPECLQAAELADLKALASHAGILRAQEEHNAAMAAKDAEIARIAAAHERTKADNLENYEKFRSWEAEACRLRAEVARLKAEVDRLEDTLDRVRGA